MNASHNSFIKYSNNATQQQMLLNPAADAKTYIQIPQVRTRMSDQSSNFNMKSPCSTAGIPGQQEDGELDLSKLMQPINTLSNLTTPREYSKRYGREKNNNTMQ